MALPGFSLHRSRRPERLRASERVFPPHIEAVLDRFGIAPDTRSALYDLYLGLGPAVLELFAERASRVEQICDLRPEMLEDMRPELVSRYLRHHHQSWLEGKATPSFWHPREAEGRASGLVVPLGSMDPGDDSFAGEIARVAHAVLPAGQPIPGGVLLLSRNAHFGGRSNTVSFDIVTGELDEALEIGGAEGRQHTIPGSVGEASGTIDLQRSLGLIWEVQPNVLKPAGPLNRSIARLYGRHRNWHLTTLLASVVWMRAQGLELMVVRGNALRSTHEVNPQEPISETIMEFHDRTVEAAVAGLGLRLEEPDAEQRARLVFSVCPNTGLRRLLESPSGDSAVWRVTGDPDVQNSDAGPSVSGVA